MGIDFVALEEGLNRSLREKAGRAAQSQRASNAKVGAKELLSVGHLGKLVHMTRAECEPQSKQRRGDDEVGSQPCFSNELCNNTGMRSIYFLKRNEK